MIDKIFKLFFTAKKPSKKTACLTLVRRSSLINKENIDLIQSNNNDNVIEELTCLSRYFKDIKGLNLVERQIANLYTSR